MDINVDIWRSLAPNSLEILDIKCRPVGFWNRILKALFLKKYVSRWEITYEMKLTKNTCSQ